MSSAARSVWLPPVVGGWFVGAKAIYGNPYDGHTLKGALRQIKRIAKLPEHVFVDMGYRGHGYKGKVKIHVDKRRRGRTANMTFSAPTD